MLPRDRLAWAQRAAGRCQAGTCWSGRAAGPAEEGWWLRAALCVTGTDKNFKDLKLNCQINLRPSN